MNACCQVKISNMDCKICNETQIPSKCIISIDFDIYNGQMLLSNCMYSVSLQYNSGFHSPHFQQWFRISLNPRMHNSLDDQIKRHFLSDIYLGARRSRKGTGFMSVKKKKSLLRLHRGTTQKLQSVPIRFWDES